MGDYAKGIAKINLLIDKKSTKAKSILDLKEMTDIAVSMLKRAIEAFVNVDVETARSLPQEDDRVDELFNQIYDGHRDRVRSFGGAGAGPSWFR